MELTQSDKPTILKVDLDIHPPDEWLEDWIQSRKLIISSFGLETTKIRYHPSEHGWHFWFHLDQEISYDQTIRLQFLLGDDTARVWFGLQRKGFKRFRDKFNILFTRKWLFEKKEG